MDTAASYEQGALGGFVGSGEPGGRGKWWRARAGLQAISGSGVRVRWSGEVLLRTPYGACADVLAVRETGGGVGVGVVR